MADPSAVVTTPEQAGFVSVTFGGDQDTVYYGPDVAAALEWVRRLACTNDMLRSLDAASAQRSLEHLRDALANHAGTDGIWFDSRAWLMSALFRFYQRSRF